MYKVVVENECQCFIKSKKPYEQSFEKSFPAYIAAQDMVEEMEKTFCKKHKFNLTKSSDGKTFTITMA